MSSIINIDGIMNMIPHRYPFLLVDRIVEIKPNESIIGIKNVTFNEPQFTGHFPSRPIMPGVLIIEALAQVSAVLVSHSMDCKLNKEVLFMSIDSAKFRKIVEPGDTVYLHSEIKHQRSEVRKFAAQAFVNDKLVTESLFTAMVRNKSV